MHLNTQTDLYYGRNHLGWPNVKLLLGPVLAVRGRGRLFG